MPDTIASEIAAFLCPAPIQPKDRIVLGHGSGGRLSAELLRNIFLPLFSNPVLDRMDDYRRLKRPNLPVECRRE